jgi:hypothetical protein
MLNIPAKIGEFDPAGAVAVLTVLVDDYAEIWINGQMAAAQRLSEPGDDPGAQHAQSRGAHHVGQDR